MNKQDWIDHEKLIQALKWSLYYARKYIEDSKKSENKIYFQCLEKSEKDLEQAENKSRSRGRKELPPLPKKVKATRMPNPLTGKTYKALMDAEKKTIIGKEVT